MSADLLRGVQFRSRFGSSARGGESALSTVLLRGVGLGLVGLSRILLRVRVFHMSGILVLLRKGLGCLHLLASKDLDLVIWSSDLDFLTRRNLMQFDTKIAKMLGDSFFPRSICCKGHNESVKMIFSEIFNISEN